VGRPEQSAGRGSSSPLRSRLVHPEWLARPVGNRCMRAAPDRVDAGNASAWACSRGRLSGLAAAVWRLRWRVSSASIAFPISRGCSRRARSDQSGPCCHQGCIPRSPAFPAKPRRAHLAVYPSASPRGRAVARTTSSPPCHRDRLGSRPGQPSRNGAGREFAKHPPHALSTCLP